MNSRQLKKLGVPDDCVRSAIVAIQAATKSGGLKGKQIKQAIRSVVECPEDFTNDEHFGPFAKDVIADREFVRPDAIDYRTWGNEIDQAAHGQMKQACSVPMAAGAALMPDAHVGYGLPIGGVLALEGAVIPYAVGVDIACRMKLSVLDMPPSTLDDKFNLYKEALEGGTRFGVGSTHEKPQNHAVMDQDWSITRITREKKDVAWSQENHHNFAWKEVHGGREQIVHRKGATPAGEGVLGVIPGSMASPAFVVRGRGNAESLNSASHGAGRRMSRKKAKDKYNWKAVQKDLEKKGVKVLSAGADEVPGVYKDIQDVMREQADLVEIVARFDPKIVKMCDDGSRAED